MCSEFSLALTQFNSITTVGYLLEVGQDGKFKLEPVVIRWPERILL